MKRLSRDAPGWKMRPTPATVGNCAALVVASLSSWLLGAAGLNAQELEQASFSDYQLIQYATTAGFAPQSVIEADDNGEILLACRAGVTRQQLAERGLAPLQSQILALRMIGVLEESADGVLRTIPPLLDPAATRQLRTSTRTAAEGISRELEDDVRVLLSALAAGGHQENVYAILFSYVVDGLVWELLEDRGELEPRRITAARPFWSGEIWAVSPAREIDAVGTNSISDSGVTLKVAWTHDALPVEAGFMFDWTLLERILDLLAVEGSRLPADLRASLEPWGLTDAEKIALPVVVENEGDALYDAAYAIADRLASVATRRLDLDRLATAFGLRDRAQALVIAYHELIWDLMELWEQRGLVERPRLLAAPESASPTDVGAVVFAVIDDRQDR